MDETPLAPALLLAMPQLLDPNFKRAVVLLIHHDDEGTFGLVLNRPAEISAADLCSSLEIEWRGPLATPVHWGGPVQPNTGWVLMTDATTDEEDDATELAPGVRFGGSLATLRHVAQAPPDCCRLILGYAGWGPGQLEDELAQGSWLLAPLTPDVIFGMRSEEMWERVVRSLGIDPVTLVAMPGVH